MCQSNFRIPDRVGSIALLMIGGRSVGSAFAGMAAGRSRPRREDHLPRFRVEQIRMLLADPWQ